MEKISRLDLFRLYLRSFFVQTGWNFERMMAFGFTWILLPLMERLFPAKEEKEKFLRRHLLSFNANPYLAAYAVGAVAKLEETRVSSEEISRFRDSMRGPLGALGDNLIWVNVRSALLILGIILASTVGALGVVVFWLFYNTHQVYLRGRGLYRGYALGSNVASELQSRYYPQMIKWISRMGAVLLGLFFLLRLNDTISEGAENPIVFVFIVFLSILGFRKNTNPNYILLTGVFFFIFARWIILLA
jgi:mannose/fructose/N-acetylgalactosamine-specific phosphotransferase system component IID